MRRALGLLLAVAILSGCAARSTGESAGAPPASATPSATPAAGPSSAKAAPSPGDSVISLPPGLPKATAVGPPTDDFTALETSGTVRVRGACVELVSTKQGQVWVLIGEGVSALRDGDRVKVKGLPDPGIETQCMGSPLKVSAVTPQ